MNTQCTAAVVVLYNQRCEESPTCRGLLAMEHGLSVLIYDNSTKDYGIKAECERRGWVYLGGQGNAGLSKAYNVCIDYLLQHNFSGLVCLFDDDTQVAAEYFEALHKEAAGCDADIFVPIIQSGKRILSPSLLFPRQKVSLFSTQEAVYSYTGNALTAINSGMAMRIGIFAHYRYDEAIFLDGIDHHFVQDMKSRGVKIHVLHYCCHHDFSGDSNPGKVSALTRFRIFSKDYSYILRKQKSVYFSLVGKRALHLCMLYRSLSFLTIFCRNFPDFRK